MGIGLVTATFLLTIVSLIYLLVKKRYAFWTSRGIPSIPATFPYGNMKGFRQTVFMHEYLQNIYNKFKNISPVVGIHMIFDPSLVIVDLDLAKNMLIRDFHNFTDRGIFYNSRDDPLSANIFLLDGAEWKTMRHKLSPTFTSGKMKFMFPTILEVGSKFSDVFMDNVNKSSNIEIKDLLARFTTDVIGTCAFGIECNSLKDPNNEFCQMGKRVFTKRRHGPVGDALLFNCPNFARSLRMKLNEDIVSDFYLKVVRDTVQYRKKNNVQRNDFLNLLMNIQKDSGSDHTELTVEEIAAQVFLFFLAGFETSSTTMGFCLYELALNPEIQDKLRNEILEVINGNNGVFSYECMSKMHYMDQVIYETLRKYPIVTHLQRKSVTNYKIEGGDHFIPKNTQCFIPVYAIQHDPELYPEPEKFNPERFTPENLKDRHATAFLGFGDGPRNCVGLRFGKMQIRVGLVKLLSKFKFSANENTTIPMKFDIKNAFFFLSADGGTYLKVEKI